MAFAATTDASSSDIRRICSFGAFPCPHSFVQTSYQRGGEGVTRELGQRNSGPTHSWLALALQTESQPTSTVRQIVVDSSLRARQKQMRKADLKCERLKHVQPTFNAQRGTAIYTNMGSSRNVIANVYPRISPPAGRAKPQCPRCRAPDRGDQVFRIQESRISPGIWG